MLCLRVCGGRGRLLLMLRRAIDLLVCGFHGRHEPVADGTALSWAPCHAHAMAFSWALRATGCSGRVVEHMPLSNCVGGWGLKRRLRSGRGGLKSCNVVLGPNHKRPKGHTPRSSGGARHAVPLKLKLIKSCTTRGGPRLTHWTSTRIASPRLVVTSPGVPTGLCSRCALRML